MGTSSGTTRGAAVLLLPVAVVAIVLGILGMHALQQHDSMSGGSHDMASMTHAAGLVADEVVAAPADDSDRGMGAMAMTCVFMLAAAGLALLALVARRGPRVAVPVRTAPSMQRAPVVLRLDSGPPPVWAFSVIRR